tara:strand:- start:20381 stop:20572 length:192 start_codon:yes stop_codon:yes gene_type:complete
MSAEETRECCQQLHDAATTLFEEMFDEKGQNLLEPDEAEAIIDQHERKILSILFDLRMVFSYR